MARKPNYDFERKERERLKSERNAARAEAKIKAEQDADGPLHVEDQRSDSTKD